MKKNTMESENGYKKGFWTEEEDKILVDYIKVNGKGRWNHISKKTGLKRCGKSCRLRWMNYLSPNVKRGNFTEQEEDLIIRLHNLLGNRWALIAKRVPGRTDNQVKNYWNTHLIKKLAVNNNEKTGRLKINDRSSRIGVSSSKISKPDTNPGRNECVSPIETSAITVDEGFQKSTQELTLKESYDQNSFWFYDDHSLEFSTIFETESFDGYFL